MDALAGHETQGGHGYAQGWQEEKDRLAHRQGLRKMVDCQIRTFDVSDLLVLRAFEEVPRLPFVASSHAHFVCSDMVLPCSAPPGVAPRAMLAPFLQARLMEALAIQRSMRILDVAGGAGYGAALLAFMGANVTMLEETGEQANHAHALLTSLSAAVPQCAAIATTHGALGQGGFGNAPYDGIIINGAVEAGLESLFAQLADGGRLVAVRHEGAPKAVVWEKHGKTITPSVLCAGAAPLLAAFAKPDQFAFA